MLFPLYFPVMTPLFLRKCFIDGKDSYTVVNYSKEVWFICVNI